MLGRGGWDYGQELAGHDPLYLQATTATLSAIIVMQVANVFLSAAARRTRCSAGGWRPIG